MRLSHLSFIAILLGSNAFANGDVLQVPPAEGDGYRAPATAQGEVPVRGMTKQQVEARFGAPLERIPAVGEPPISRWVYPDYTVYFEHQYVLHSVRKKQ